MPLTDSFHDKGFLGFRSLNPPKAAGFRPVNYEDGGLLLDNDFPSSISTPDNGTTKSTT